LKGEDAAQIRQLTEILTRASHKLAESMYRQQGGPHGNGPQAGQTGGGHTRANQASNNDDVVDAEYQEVA
jgi:molecular chaperone DnaK